MPYNGLINFRTFVFPTLISAGAHIKTGRLCLVSDMSNALVASRVNISNLKAEAIETMSRSDIRLIVGAAVNTSYSWSLYAAAHNRERLVPSGLTLSTNLA